MGLFQSAYEAVKLKILKRSQYESVALRRYFARNYGIEVGLYSYGCFDRWRMPGPLRVGRFCSIAGTVRVVPRNHSMAALTTHPVLYDAELGVVGIPLPQPPTLNIEDDVWIGHNSIILPNCKYIGRGSIIGAGSVVTKNVEAYSIVAGNPARKIKDRFPEDTIEAIENSRWWELNIDELRRVMDHDSDFLMAPTKETFKKWHRNIDIPHP
jgi:virginiamycin A acetyltransferase